MTAVLDRCAPADRIYDPTTGTFLSPDPMDGVDGTPTVANAYHYADNDPLNKTDPLGLRPNDDDDFGPCPEEFGDFDDVGGACAIGPSYADDDPEFAYLGNQPLALSCSNSQIPAPAFDIADLQDGDVNVDCTVIFNRTATRSLDFVMGIEHSRTRVIESLCGERTIVIDVNGNEVSIDIDPNLVQGQINEHLSALEDLGVNIDCVPFLNEANGSLSGNLEEAVSRNACLGFRVRAEGPDFDWGGVDASEGWEPIVVQNAWAGSWIVRFRRDWVVVDAGCHG